MLVLLLDSEQCVRAIVIEMVVIKVATAPLRCTVSTSSYKSLRLSSLHGECSSPNPI
ncbi:hypothetical protein PAHAL_9G400900 [Panicum hallii]|uniref:Uncharacterized protein n=1 Tax=Panicum hallii TaxID=206008 RepID=A0A2T8I477_9POAL|nr:hypothetical protein PAHAL_9G400900 [Panicum hallii]